MKKQKFVFITRYYPGIFFLLEKEDYQAVPCRIMKELGYDVEIVTILREGLKTEEIVRGIKVKRFKNTFSLLKYLYFSKDIILVHSILRPHLPSLLSSLINKPKIMTPCTYVIGSNKLIAFLSLVLMKKFDLLFHLTPYELGIYQRAGIDKSKLKLLPMPIDYRFFSKKIHNLDAVKKKWGIRKNDFVVITLCNLKAVKNVDVILRAFFLLKNKVKNAKFILVGSNSLGSPRYKDKYQKKHNFILKDLLGELSIKRDVIITGILTLEELRQTLNIANVYVNSSSVESQCLSAYESSAVGLPLCLSNIGSFRSVFKDKVLYHNPRDHKKLAENLLFYFNNPQKTRAMGSRLRTFVKKWDYDIIKKRIITCYKSVLEKYYKS